MSNISFSNALLLSFSRTGTQGKAHFSASLTSSVIKAMQWHEVPECLTGGNLEGELAAHNMNLIPDDEALKRHQIGIDISRIHKFQSVRLELPESRGKGFRQELRFVVLFADVKGARKLEEYIQTCGKSTVAVSYEKAPVQEDLPGVEKPSDQGEIEEVIQQAKRSRKADPKSEKVQ